MESQSNGVVPLITPLRLSHGTIACRSLAASRRFYEEFLGLECVQHGARSMLMRKGGYWCIVCIEVGDAMPPVGIDNHWGLDLHCAEQVRQAHGLALKHQARYGITDVTPLRPSRRGDERFHLRDRDGNWWEFQHVAEENRYDRLFEAGDIEPAEAPAAAAPV
jgi:catechol 2,3-dioxygenase-like lactoylglutathione lyase family enzyme